MISDREALARVLELFEPLGSETVTLAQAGGRVLAKPGTATLDQPPFAASAMDGHAVQSADIKPGATLRVIGESAAGGGFAGEVAAGEAVRIFTGAPVPGGADRVVIQENCSASGQTVRTRGVGDPGQAESHQRRS